MKVAVFSDIQGNLPALEAVTEDILAWKPDLTVMNGDLVNRGPLSLDCLKLFKSLRQSHAWLPLKGNHEDYILACRRPADNALEAEMRRFADWTLSQLGDQAEIMAGWADHLTLPAPDTDQWIHITHGTLAGNRNGISASVADEALVNRLPSDIELFVTAHTHKVHRRIFNEIPIVNIGSAGSPFDGDVRGSYARLTFRNGGWRNKIVRIGYDRTRCEQDFRTSGFLDEGGPLAQVIFQEWKRAVLLMPHWKRGYRDAVRQGKLSLEQSVHEFLSQL